MNDVLLHVVRREQGAIAEEFSARLTADGSPRPTGATSQDCPRLLAVLLANWQNADPTPARRWAQETAANVVAQGLESGPVLESLDALAAAIRVRLLGQCDDEPALLAAVAELDAGLGLLR